MVPDSAVAAWHHERTPRHPPPWRSAAPARPIEHRKGSVLDAGKGCIFRYRLVDEEFELLPSRIKALTGVRHRVVNGIVGGQLGRLLILSEQMDERLNHGVVYLA